MNDIDLHRILHEHISPLTLDLVKDVVKDGVFEAADCTATELGVVRFTLLTSAITFCCLLWANKQDVVILNRTFPNSCAYSFNSSFFLLQFRCWTRREAVKLLLYYQKTAIRVS